MIENIESAFIHAATDESFKALVLDNSEKGPVLVNFWSKKAGPCLRQYPLLDQLVHNYQGKFLLINVDTETEVICTKEYGISSVPTLKLFRRGQVQASLHGFQDEAALKQLIEAHISRVSDQTLAEALALYSQNQQEAAYGKIAEAIIDDPDNPRLPLALAKLLMHEQRIEEADKLLNALPSPVNQDPEILQMQARLYFFKLVQAIELDEAGLITRAQTEPDLLIAKQELVAHYVMTDQLEAAFALLLDKTPTDAEKALLQQLFRLLGDNPLVATYRNQLQTLLN